MDQAALEPGDRITHGSDRAHLRAGLGSPGWTSRSPSRSSSASSPCSTCSCSGWRAAPSATSRAPRSSTRPRGTAPSRGAGAGAARPLLSAPACSPRLEVVAAMGYDPGTLLDVSGGVTLGRADGAEIKVEDQFASSNHARIYERGEFMYIEDMGSTNGTYLNGRQLRTQRAAQAVRRDPHRRQRVPLPGVEGVALRIVEYAATSDVGRQRETNEDALFVAPPLFAVADGMGGARPARWPRQLATKAFEEHGESAEPPERQLTMLAQEANRRIYDLAERDESRRGMGTTLTLGQGDRRRGGARPRGRQPRLPPARRRARAAHARPLAGGRARAQRPDLAGGGRAPSAEVDHHPRARTRSPTWRWTPTRSPAARATCS